MPRLTWRQRSALIIRQRIAEADEKMLIGKTRRDYIRDYPYAAKMGAAYKAWLATCRELLDGVPYKSEKRNRRRRPTSAPLTPEQARTFWVPDKGQGE